MNENEQIQLSLAACWETSGLLRAWDISTQRQAAREASRLFADVQTAGLFDRPPTAELEEDVDPGVAFDADNLEPPSEADQAQAMEGVLAAAMAAQAAAGQSAAASAAAQSAAAPAQSAAAPSSSAAAQSAASSSAATQSAAAPTLRASKKRRSGKRVVTGASTGKRSRVDPTLRECFSRAVDPMEVSSAAPARATTLAATHAATQSARPTQTLRPTRPDSEGRSLLAMGAVVLSSRQNVE